MGNKAQCAEFFGVSPYTVESWIRGGMPVIDRGSRGVSAEIDLLAAAEWKFSKRFLDQADPEQMVPQDRRAWYESEVKRRDLQNSDRKLIPSHDLERTVSTALAMIESTIRAIPGDLEHKAGIPSEASQAVEKELNQALDTLKARLAEIAPVDD